MCILICTYVHMNIYIYICIHGYVCIHVYIVIYANAYVCKTDRWIDR